MNKEEIEAKKQELKESADNYFDDIVSSLKDNQESFKRYMDLTSRLHTYSSNNISLLSMQNEKRRHSNPNTQPIEAVAGFQFWAKLKGENGERCKIKKDEKAYSIYRPNRYKLYKKNEKGAFLKAADGKKIPELDDNGKQKTRLSFALASVFDINQTNAKEIGAWQSLNQRIENISYDEDTYALISNSLDGANISVNSEDPVNERLSNLFYQVGLINCDSGNNDQRHIKARFHQYLCCKALGIKADSNEFIDGLIKEAPEYLKETIPTVVTSFNQFAKKVDFKSLAEDHSYKETYPVHYIIYHGLELKNYNFDEELLSLEDTRGYTPAMVAASEGHEEALIYLEDKNVNLQHKNKYGVSVESIQAGKTKKLPSPVRTI